MRRYELELLSSLFLSSLEYLRVRIYSAFTADITKGSVEGHLADFSRKRFNASTAYQERTELLVERNPYLCLGLLCYIHKKVPGVINVFRSYPLTITIACSTEAFHEKHALNISLRLSLWAVIKNSVYFLIREID